MMRAISLTVLWVLIVSLPGCSSNGAGAPVPTGPSTPTPTPAPSPSPLPSPSPSPAPAACAVTVNNLPASVPAKEDTYSFGVVTGAGCAWTARSDAPWADLAPGSGTGPDTVRLTAAESTRIDPRTAVLTIGGQSYSVRQEGYTCTYTISDAALEARNEGGSFEVRVSAAAGCRWSVTTSAGWITLQTKSGEGTDYAYFSVAANGGAARQGVVTIAGRTVTINQAAG